MKQEFHKGDKITFDDQGPVTVTAYADRYYMLRRGGETPFVMYYYELRDKIDAYEALQVRSKQAEIQGGYSGIIERENERTFYINGRIVHRIRFTPFQGEGKFKVSDDAHGIT